MSGPTHDLDTCSCCAPDPEPAIDNPPGARALRYRIGTHRSFLDRMLHQIPIHAIESGPTAGTRPLARLTSREPDDPSIAMMDAWAVVADILTFYQERIANEGYLRTATERRSILELARTIGYELKPGVAAATSLAFTVEQPPEPAPFVPPQAGRPGPAVQSPAPSVVPVPAGTKVQSMPGPGELPQTFETTQAIEARAAWNALRPVRGQRQQLSVESGALRWRHVSGSTICRYLWLDGTSTALSRGDWLLVIVGSDNRVPGDPVSEAVQTGWVVVRVHAVTADQDAGRTQVEIAQSGAADRPPFEVPEYTEGVPTTDPLPLDAGTVQAQIRERAWDEHNLAALIALQEWDPDALVARVRAASEAEPPPARVVAFRQMASIFGAASPPSASLEQQDNNPWPDWDASPPTVWTTSAGTFVSGADLYLDRVVSKLSTPGHVLLRARGHDPEPFGITSITEATLADFAISAKCTGLELRRMNNVAVGSFYKNNAGAKYKMRTTTAWLQSEELALAPMPIDGPVQAGPGEGIDHLDLEALALGLQVGQSVAVSGVPVDSAGVSLGAARSELAKLVSIRHIGGRTRLELDTPLAAAYDRATLSICANVAPATHGETVTGEILGSGSGSRGNQRFTLARSPLTWVSASTPGGAASTLRVEVDGVAWREVPSLYGAAAGDRVYQLRGDDEGKTHVSFGDGVTGARLPTGTANVVATYRSGLGEEGEVEAGRLSLLQSRPLGVRGASNPIDATGAEGPETRDRARRNAPRTVTTLDRIVSLSDYEDFSSGFAGIGKAKATPVWRGDVRIVHITVATASGGVVDPDSALYQSLRAAIVAASDGSQLFQIDSYVPRLFRADVTLAIEPARDPADIEAASKAQLRSCFDFEHRQFAQPVTQSELMVLMHDIPGVVSAQVNALHRADLPVVAGTVVDAAIAHWDRATGSIAQAELLLIDPLGIHITAGNA